MAPANRIIQRDEVDGLLMACDKDPKCATGTRDAAIMSMGGPSGRRRREVVRPARVDFSARRGVLRAFRLKTDRTAAWPVVGGLPSRWDGGACGRLKSDLWVPGPLQAEVPSIGREGYMHSEQRELLLRGP